MTLAPPAASGALPEGIRRLPGPGVLVAASYTASPVGPYRELAIAVPARAGSHVGMCVTTMVVDDEASRFGGRRLWGFPKELSELRWEDQGDAVCLRWGHGGVEVRARRRAPTLPLGAPLWCLQRRDDGLVTVAGWLVGRSRPADVVINAPTTGPLATLGGRRAGLVATELRLVVRPARPLRRPV